MFILFLSYLSLFSLALIDNARGNLLPIIQESLSLDATTAAFIFTGGSLSNCLFNLWLPKIRQKFQLRNLYITSLLMMPLSVIFWNFSEIKWCYFLAPIVFGVGAGGIGTFCNIYVSASTSIEKRQNALSFLHSMYGIASFLVPVFITFLMKSMTWQKCLIFLSIPSLLVGLSFFKSDRSIAAELPSTHKTPWHLFWVALIFMMGILSEIFISSRLVDYLYREVQFSFDRASLYLSVFFGCLLSGRLLFSFVKFKMKKINLLLLSFSMTILLSMIALNGHPIYFAFTGISASWFFPVAISWIREEFESSFFSLVSMIMSFNSLALVLMHFIVGELTETIGISKLMVLPAIFSIIAIITIFLFKKSLKAK
jgi:FHS family glucose/mannose:H+ symporter-like MFS transporter